MVFLGWLFFKILFADWVAPETPTECIAGMILLGVAPCTAMVFVWSQLTKGDANYTLVQVSVTDVIMIFAFAPITSLLLGVTDIAVPWDTLVLSVLLYVLVPLIAGALTRKQLLNNSDNSRLEILLKTMKPWSIVGLPTTVVLLFGFQSETILSKPEVIVLIAIPLLTLTYGIFAIAYWFAKRLKLPLFSNWKLPLHCHCLACIRVRLWRQL